MFNAIRALRTAAFLFCLLGLTGHATANDHGGGGVSDIVSLEAITTNLASKTGKESRFIQLVIALRLHDPQAAAAITAYMPQIRHDILLVLSSHTGEDLKLTSGRETLVDEIKDAVNGVIGTPARTDKKGKRIAGEGPVKQVFFTSFIVQ
ncbi:flagellar basal body-associated FliL family protein [Zoogloea dura]|jgi:flagellar FliL protein|uniref:Flagellar protein FliL n=1 Tax=Zoogloea dura TaxID=2728840 RepID=A0A848G6S0_9RHOO|nr:flagellar basal body-associated FliL family protein [Zoogloea dura]NML26924.1 flagellar basal body-associated FliL family protein [Zoogloea dura]